MLKDPERPLHNLYMFFYLINYYKDRCFFFLSFF